MLCVFRRYLPPLKSFPAQYIYEPWTAPLDIQQQAGCVVGHDYPAPMLDHYQALHSNMLSLQQFVQSLKERVGEYILIITRIRLLELADVQLYNHV